MGVFEWLTFAVVVAILWIVGWLPVVYMLGVVLNEAPAGADSDVEVVPMS